MNQVLIPNVPVARRMSEQGQSEELKEETADMAEHLGRKNCAL